MMGDSKHSLMWKTAAAFCLLAVQPVYAQSLQDSDPDIADVATASNAGTATAPETVDPQNDATDGKKPKGTGSSEVEHNEENYRRFMELRERDPRTNTMPTNTFQPGTEKLDGLPESSQKHLRNQLREVIVEEGAWQEGDENKRYGYVPSEEAQSDRQLQLREAEAWDELVGKYQEREAQIHSNSARSQAARKSADAAASSGEAGSERGGQSGSPNAGQQGSEGQDAGSQAQTAQSGQAGQEAQQRSSESRSQQSQDSAATAANEAQQAEARNAGVSENALEFLTQGQNGAQALESNQGRQAPLTGSETDQQQDSSAQSSESADSDSKDETADALEDETSESDKTPEPVFDLTPSNTVEEISDEGTTQNALEALGRSTQSQPSPPADTLSIQDLINAQGLSVDEVPDETASDNDDKEQPD